MRHALLTAVMTLALPGFLTEGLRAGLADQQTTADRQAAARFRLMDTNGDGVITRGEWRGGAQTFRVHDWNNDGVLSGLELIEAVRGGDRPDNADYDTALTFNNDWSASRFAALDRNRDGRIARMEWVYELDTFRRADRDRDGVLVREEFLDGHADDDRAGRVSDSLDYDGNNRVTPLEWHEAAFGWLEATPGGGRSGRVAGEGEGAALPADLFTRLDTNRNDRLSPAEWQWSRSSFDQLDATRDGVLTRAELAGRSAPAGPDTVTMSVGGPTGWIDTGLYLVPGDAITVQATGRVQMSADPADVADPGGSTSRRLIPNAPMPARLAGALIARIEAGPALFVGARSEPLRTIETGRLFLSVNDDHLDDNRGEFRVVVTVQRNAP